MKSRQFEPMQKPKGASHPSGRPHQHGRFGVTSKPRVPFDGALSPGLQRRGTQDAIGFTVGMLPGSDEDDLD